MEYMFGMAENYIKLYKDIKKNVGSESAAEIIFREIACNQRMNRFYSSLEVMLGGLYHPYVPMLHFLDYSREGLGEGRGRGSGLVDLLYSDSEKAVRKAA